MTRQYTLSKSITYASVASVLCTLLHSSPVYLPVAGMLLSPISTLPILLVTMLNPLSGIFTWVCTTTMLFFLSPQEAAIFFCTTGCLGLVLGFVYRAGFFRAIVLAAGALFAGILVLIYLFGIAAFGSIGQIRIEVFLPAVLVFSFLYSLLWALILKHLAFRIIKIIERNH